MVTDPMEKSKKIRRRAAEEAQDVKWIERSDYRIKADENGKRYVDRKVRRRRQEDDWKFREKRRERHHGKAETRDISLTCDYIGLKDDQSDECKFVDFTFNELVKWGFFE